MKTKYVIRIAGLNKKYIDKYRGKLYITSLEDTNLSFNTVEEAIMFMKKNSEELKKKDVYGIKGISGTYIVQEIFLP